MQSGYSSLFTVAALAGLFCSGPAQAGNAPGGQLIIRALAGGVSVSADRNQIHFPNGLTLIARSWRQSRPHTYVDLTLPWLVPEADSRARAFNIRTEALAGKEMSMLEPVRGELMPADRPDSAHDDSVDVNFEVILATGDLISVKIHKNVFFWSAMHPRSTTKTINYALDSGRIINLGDVFRPDSGYLEALSTYCIEALMQRSRVTDLSNREWVERGAAAKAENFRNWNIGRDGLIFTFNEYQVAPYAAGSFEVTIPYARLVPVIRKNGILKDVISQSGMDRPGGSGKSD